MIQDGRGYGQSRLEQSIKTNHVKQEKKNFDFILGTSQKLFVTFSRMKEERDIPFFISKDAAAGYKS